MSNTRIDRRLDYDRPKPMERPMNFELVEFGAGDFETESLCNSAATNCKANYFGTIETDPFVSRKPCKQLTFDGVTKWYNICEMKGNRIRGNDNWSKFAQEFKPNGITAPVSYLDFVTPLCAQQPSHNVCKDIIFDMIYNKESEPSYNRDCDQYIRDTCKSGRYGGDSDPLYTVPAKCIRDPEIDDPMGFNYQYPWCKFQSRLISSNSYANTFNTDFAQTPNIIGKEFLLSSYCDTNPESPLCRDKLILFGEQKSSTLDGCNSDLQSNPTPACDKNYYDNGNWIDAPLPCTEVAPGEFRHGCYAWTNVNVSDADAEKINRYYNREIDSRNELAYKLVMRPYCFNVENRMKFPCLTNSTLTCRSEPWKLTCGGNGDKCFYVPNATECNPECTANPWLAACGGDGNQCPFDHNAPGCEQCITQPWLELCGGDGNACPFDPNAPGCDQCKTQPWLTSCGGDGNACPFDPNAPGCEQCKTQPWLELCGGDGDKCKYNPDLPECKVPDPACTTQPWLLSCGGTGDRCDFNADFPECVIAKDRHPFVWIALLVIAIIVTYMVMKKGSANEHLTEILAIE